MPRPLAWTQLAGTPARDPVPVGMRPRPGLPVPAPRPGVGLGTRPTGTTSHGATSPGLVTRSSSGSAEQGTCPSPRAPTTVTAS